MFSSAMFNQVQLWAQVWLLKDSHRVILTSVIWYLASVLWLCSYWKMNLSPEVQTAPGQIIIKNPLYFTTFIFTKSPNFCCGKTSPQDDAAIIMLQCRNGIGQVMSSARHDAWHSGQFNFCFIRPETFVFLWFESRVSELDRTWALIAAKGAPIKYWAKAVNTYVHVIFLLLFYLFSIHFQEFQTHFFTFYFELFCVDFQDEKFICSGIRL